MPKFHVTDPSGKTWEVNAPEGATQDQAIEYVKSQQAASQTPAASARQRPPAPANLDVGINAANKAIAGVPDALLNAPTNVLNLAKAGFGTAATALGRNDLAPDLTRNPDYIRRLFEGLGLIRPTAEPATAGQRMLDATVQGATGAAMNPAGSVGQTLATAAAGGLSGLAAGATKELTGSDALANSVSILAPAAVGAVKSSAQSKAEDLASRQAKNAPRDQALAAGLEAGYKIPPATAVPSLKNKVIESIAGKAATQQDASLNNVEVTDALSRRALGLPPDTPLTVDVTRQVRRDAYNAGYKPVEAAGLMTTGAAYRKDLNDIVSKYQGAARSFPGAVRNDVVEMVDGLRRRSFDAGDAIKMTQTLRDDASKSFANGDAALGTAQRAAAMAIENQIERNLPRSQPELIQNFRDARQLMAKSHTVEDALKVGTGHVDANKIAAELQKGTPLSGELKVIGEFANNFRKAVQTPQVVGSPGVSKVAAISSMMLGGGGAAAAGPYGAAMGALPLLAPPAARGYLMSNRYQRGLQPNYETGLLGQGAQLADPSILPALLFSDELRRGQ